MELGPPVGRLSSAIAAPWGRDAFITGSAPLRSSFIERGPSYPHSPRVGDSTGTCRLPVRHQPKSRAGAPAVALGLLAVALNPPILASQAVPATVPPPASASLAGHPGVMLQPGDVIRLKIWREPDLSGDYEVDPYGRAVFPKVGTVAVTTMSSDSLQRLLLATYAQWLRDPAIEVTPLRRVNVLGEVRNPGLYQVDPTLTVADVLAMAGGTSSEGNRNNIELIRQGRAGSIRLRQDSRLSEWSIRSGDQLQVQERSWFSRNGAMLVGASITAAAVIVATVIRP